MPATAQAIPEVHGVLSHKTLPSLPSVLTNAKDWVFVLVKRNINNKIETQSRLHYDPSSKGVTIEQVFFSIEELF